MENDKTITLIHVSKSKDKEVKLERTFTIRVAEKAMNDSKRKSNLNWTLPEKSKYEFKSGSLVAKK